MNVFLTWVSTIRFVLWLADHWPWLARMLDKFWLKNFNDDEAGA